MIYISYIFEWMVFEFLAQSIYHNLINNNECILVTNNDSDNIKWNDGDILIVIPQFCWKFITLKLKEKQIKIIIINKSKHFIINI